MAAIDESIWCVWVCDRMRANEATSAMSAAAIDEMIGCVSNSELRTMGLVIVTTSCFADKNGSGYVGRTACRGRNGVPAGFQVKAERAEPFRDNFPRRQLVE